MKTFFLLNVTNKHFPLISEIFEFDNVDDFCSVAEYFNLRSEHWDISSNTNTKNIIEYIAFRNTNISEKYILNNTAFESIKDVDVFYKNKKDELVFSNRDYYNKIYQINSDLYSDNYSIDTTYPIFLLNSFTLEKYPFENVRALNLYYNENIKGVESSEQVFKISIDPNLISLDDYCDLIKNFSPDFVLPSFVIDSMGLFLFINSIEDISKFEAFA